MSILWSDGMVGSLEVSCPVVSTAPASTSTSTVALVEADEPKHHYENIDIFIVIIL